MRFSRIGVASVVTTAMITTAENRLSKGDYLQQDGSEFEGDARLRHHEGGQPGEENQAQNVIEDRGGDDDLPGR